MASITSIRRSFGHQVLKGSPADERLREYERILYEYYDALAEAQKILDSLPTFEGYLGEDWRF